MLFVLWILALSRWVQNGLCDESEWSYSDTNAWVASYESCGGNKQSPIDLPVEGSEGISGLIPDPIIFNNLDANLFGTLANTGVYGAAEAFKHHFKVRLMATGHSMTLTGGPLKDQVYTAKNYHVHWGSSDDQGSEHTVGGKRYPIEIHIVHLNQKYSTLEEGLQNEDGLAVVALFGEPADGGATIPLIEKPYSSVGMVHMNTFVPTNEEDMDYWTYKGSLTTPPCSEAVTWIVLKKPIQFDRSQLDLMRSTGVADNYRPTQQRNGREILLTGEEVVDDDVKENNVESDCVHHLE